MLYKVLLRVGIALAGLIGSQVVAHLLNKKIVKKAQVVKVKRLQDLEYLKRGFQVLSNEEQAQLIDAIQQKCLPKSK